MRTRSLTAALAVLALLVFTASSSFAIAPWVYGKLPLPFRNTAGPTGLTGPNVQKIYTPSGTLQRTVVDSTFTSHGAAWASATDLTGLADTTVWVRGMPYDWFPEAFSAHSVAAGDTVFVGRLYFVPDGSNAGNGLVASMDTIRVTLQYSADDDDFGVTATGLGEYTFTGSAAGVFNTKGYERNIFDLAVPGASPPINSMGGIAHAVKWRVIFRGDQTGRYQAYLLYPRVTDAIESQTAKGVRK